VSRMTTPQTRPQQTLTARCPEDLLAVARVVLGFEPADSVVMLTVGQHQFHARVDLPGDGAEIEALARCLVDPARRHRVQATVLVLYTPDARLGRRVAGRVRRRLESAGIAVIDALRVDAGRWYPLLRDREGLGATGVPYDVSAHPFVAAAVVDGRVLHDTRDELAATLDPRPDEVAAVAAVGLPEPAGYGWVRSQVAKLVAAGATPDAGVAARLLDAVTDPSVRDAAWCHIRRDDARQHVELWSDLVRRSPEGLVAHAAGVLAFAAWVAGDGALAWCAVDRARETDPEHSLACLVADLLVGAVPPSEWERVSARRPA
jgi:hypothetical protein